LDNLWVRLQFEDDFFGGAIHVPPYLKETMNIVKISIDTLVPDPNNSRKHSKKNIDAI